MNIHPYFKILSLAAIVMIVSSAASAQIGLWTEKDESALRTSRVLNIVRPTAYKVYGLDRSAMRAELRNAPEEFSGSSMKKSLSSDARWQFSDI